MTRDPRLDPALDYLGVVPFDPVWDDFHFHLAESETRLYVAEVMVHEPTPIYDAVLVDLAADACPACGRTGLARRVDGRPVRHKRARGGEWCPGR
jgi:hypothetical protein